MAARPGRRKRVFLQALIRAAGVYIKGEYGFDEGAAKLAAKALPVLVANRDRLAAYTDPDRLITALRSPQGRRRPCCSPDRFSFPPGCGRVDDAGLFPSKVSLYCGCHVIATTIDSPTFQGCFHRIHRCARSSAG